MQHHSVHPPTRALLSRRHGGVCISNGRIVAVPYNSAQILEIGERVCMPSDETATNSVLQPVAMAASTSISDALSSMLQPVGMAAATSAATQTFILALPGCPDDSNGAPFRMYENYTCTF